MRQYSYMYNCSSILDWTVQYGPVLDRTIWSGPAFSGTGPDYGPRLLDRTVRSFYLSPFSNNKKTGLNGPVQYFWDRTVVRRCWTVRSSLFKRSPKKATVRTGPDCGQSTTNLIEWPDPTVPVLQKSAPAT
jgi:hypothetical protein